jgi:hypothetical protein
MRQLVESPPSECILVQDWAELSVIMQIMAYAIFQRDLCKYCRSLRDIYMHENNMTSVIFESWGFQGSEN